MNIGRLLMLMGRRELLQDTHFSNAAVWTSNNGTCVVANGVATWTNASNAHGLYQAIPVTSGRMYDIVVTIDSVSGGTIQVSLGNNGGVLNPTLSTTGTHRRTVAATATGDYIGLRMNTGTTGSAVVSFFSVKAR